MKTNIEKLQKSTIKLSVTVEAEKVKETYEKVLEEAVQNTEVQGFRKGSAPKEMVRDKVGVSNLYGDVVNALLQNYYPQALKENMLMPISNPKVEIKEFDLEKDFEFTATVALMPTVKIEDYKNKLKERFEKRFKEAEEQAKKDAKEGEEAQKPHLHMGANEVIETLLEISEVEIADLLIEEETDRLLTRLINQAQSLGLSLEQYLKSQNKTADELRADYAKISEKNLKAEFVLAHLVKEEKIEVSDDEVKAAIDAVGGEKPAGVDERTQILYIKSILQKNKLISNLIEEAEGEHHHEHK